METSTEYLAKVEEDTKKPSKPLDAGVLDMPQEFLKKHWDSNDYHKTNHKLYSANDDTDLIDAQERKSSNSSEKLYLAPEVLKTSANKSIFFDALQKWEGIVVSVNSTSFVSRLKDLTNKGTDEEVILPYDKIDAEDISLIKPGAIFYLAVGYKIKNKTKHKASLIRFRRIVDWSEDEVIDAYLKGAEKLRAVSPNQSSKNAG